MQLIGVILNSEAMPDAASVQAWFDDQELPCTIDDCLSLNSSFVLSGTLLGQRCYGDAKLSDVDSGKGLFHIVYSDVFSGRDLVFTTIGTNTYTDRAFVFLIATAIASIAGGVVVDTEDPDGCTIEYMRRVCDHFVFRSRILLSFLANGSVTEYQSVDSDALPLLPNETESSRRGTISSLFDEKHIYTSDTDPKSHRLTRYKLTQSGLMLAESMYRTHNQGSATKHWNLILAKESE